MKYRRRLQRALIWTVPAISATVLTCKSSTGPLAMPSTAALVQFRAVHEIRLPRRPQGVAMTPDGRYIVVGSYIESKVQVFDGATYELLNEVFAPQPWGLAISPDGTTVFVGAKWGSVALTIPDLQMKFSMGLRTRTFQSNRSGTSYYASGHLFVPDPPSGATRYSASGALLSVFPMQIADNTNFTLTPDELFVIAVDGFGELHVLDAATMQQIRSFTVGHGPYLVVPLAMTGKVLLIGGSDAGPETMLFDYLTGETGPLRKTASSSRFPWLEYGYGNPWVSIGDDVIVIPSRQGFLIIDARTGTVEKFLDDLTTLDGANYCCEVAYDALRDRIIVVNEYASPQQALWGRLVVYDVVR